MVSVLSVFAASLFGIVALLSFKAWEMRRGALVLPGLRAALDRGALVLKQQLERIEGVLARLPAMMSLFSLQVLALVTVKLARMARGASEAAYRLADFISHKHNFERREIRSEFLKTMIEHKNGLAQPVQAVKKRRPRKTVKAAPVPIAESQEMQL